MTEQFIQTIGIEDLPPEGHLPEGHDPLADGILMAHQIAWLEDKSKLKLGEKGRRTGFTYAEALDDTLIAATKRTDGGDNVFYIGDTKEKGLEFIGYCAQFARVVAEGASDIEEYLFDDQQEDGSTRQITSYRIRFASGLRIQALSSRPAAIRGLQGVVIIDEAAFHNDVSEVIKAVIALLIWGGRVRVISTHNGVLNAFNTLVEDTRAGRNSYSLHRATFDDAVKNGLYERVCYVGGIEPTPEGKQKWYDDIRGAFGTDKDAMREELDAIPKEGAGTYIPLPLILGVTAKRPVLRLERSNEFSELPKSVRKADIDAWCEDDLLPLLEALPKKLLHFFGEDFARSGDLSVLWPLTQQQNMTLDTPFVVELRNIPFEQQKQIVYYIIDRLPRFVAAAFDARGNGQYLAEVAMQRYGSYRIAQVMLSETWYRENMPKFKAAFEDKSIIVPADGYVIADIRSIQVVNGVPKVPDGMKTRGVDGRDRHGDAGIACVMSTFAAFTMDPVPMEFRALPSKASRWDGDNDYGDRRGAW